MQRARWLAVLGEVVVEALGILKSGLEEDLM
jgi:hypothetical protein